MSRRAWTPATSKSRVSAGVQASVPGYSVNLLLFTYWYFSSGHLRFSGRWCPNLNLAKISLSLSRLKSTHPVSTGAHVAKAFCLDYASISSTVLQLQARECLLTLLPIGIAQYVMSNMSSGTSGRWCVQCDDTAYIISGILLSVVPSYK